MDIETNYVGNLTGKIAVKDFKNHRLAIVGIMKINPSTGSRVIYQLVGDECNKKQIEFCLRGINKIYTYNGRSYPDDWYHYIGFDFPVIFENIGVRIDDLIPHIDLCPECWKVGLKGGLKIIEGDLRIVRRLKEIDGLKAMEMYREWEKSRDPALMEILLGYNREDIENLEILRRRLDEINNKRPVK